MAIDVLQEKIRKMKNPSVLELAVSLSDLPPHILQEEGQGAAAYGRFCRELLDGLKQTIPAVRLSFGLFALLGPEGLTELTEVLKTARDCGYYVLLEGPEMFSAQSAAIAARSLLGEDSRFPCDGVILSGYLGSDVLKAFLPYCKEEKKDVFVAARTGNRSAPELQDLLAGSRWVHTVAADHVNRYCADTLGKFGYSRVGLMGAASAADSLRTLRAKYPKLFLLVDGYDYPNANAKNCANGFDRFGHGAAVCSGAGITCAWKQAQSDGTDYLTLAEGAAQRMKKNLTRYVSIL